MKDTLSKLFIFTAGAAIGSAVTWRILKSYYEQLAQEEIDSVKEVYSRRVSRYEGPEDSNEAEESEEPEETPSIQEYADKLKKLGYVDYSTTNKPANEEVVEEVKKPYVIHPTEFGEEDDYESETLIYYADGVLTDDDNGLIEDVENVVGEDSLTHFGEYEADSVFVRNDKLKTDFEILLDTRKYSDVINKSPHPMEDE